MSDFILVDGDTVTFEPAFGAATVAVQPGKLTGSGPAKIGGKKVCIEGDEGGVSVAGCTYTAGQYSIPGTGTLSIDSLAGDQKAKKYLMDGTPVILKGSKFNAKFEVQSPAQFQPPGAPPPPPQMDQTKSYSGKGSFVASNSIFKSA